MSDTDDQPNPFAEDGRYLAAVDLLARVGAKNYRVGHTDTDDQPVIWHATVELRQYYGMAFVRHYECAAAMDGVTATLRLAERLIDGGMCTHCGRMTVFSADPDTTAEEAMTGALGGCLYAYDPELRTFRRSCEGDAP